MRVARLGILGVGRKRHSRTISAIARLMPPTLRREVFAGSTSSYSLRANSSRQFPEFSLEARTTSISKSMERRRGRERERKTNAMLWPDISGSNVRKRKRKSLLKHKSEEENKQKRRRQKPSRTRSKIQL